MEQIQVHTHDGFYSTLSLWKVEGASRVILIFPAMGVRASYYKPLAENLAEAGEAVAVAELRGNGTHSADVARGHNFGYHEMVTHDWVSAIAAVRDHFSGCKVCLLGHSLGGQLSALHLAKYPDAADALLLVASCSVHYTGWSGLERYRKLAQFAMIKAVVAAKGSWPGHKLGFAGHEPQTQMQDWLHNAFTGRYEPVGSDFDYEQGMRRLQKPVLAISFTEDDYAPSAAVDNLLGKMPQCDQTHWDFSPADLGLVSLGHFDWVKQSRVLVPRIREWLDSKVRHFS